MTTTFLRWHDLMSNKQLIGLVGIFLLGLIACAPEPETATSPTPLPPTTVPTVTATAVPPTPEPPTATPTAELTIIPSPTATMPTDLQVISPENAGQLTQLVSFGNGRIDSIAWSPDGSTFVVGGSRAIEFYDSQTLEKTQTIPLPDQNGLGTNHIRFSPTGEWLIITMGGFEVSRATLWDVANGQFIRDIYDAAYTDFTADGQLIYYDWVAGQLVWQEPVSGHTIQTLELLHQPWAFSLASKTSAENYLDTTIRLYDLTTGQLRHTLSLEAHINGAAFSSQGNMLAVSSRDGFTRLWDVSSGNLLYQLVGQVDTSRGIVFSEDGRFLSTSGNDRAVRVWDTVTGQQLYQLTGLLPLPQTNAALVTFSPNGRELAVASGGRVQFYDTTSGSLQRTLDGYSCTRGVAFSGDGRTLISVDGYSIHTIDVNTGQLVHTRQSDEVVRTIAISPNSNLMAWGGGNQMRWLQMWNTTMSQPLYTIEEEGETVNKVTFSPDGRLLAVQSGSDWVNPLVQVYEALTGNLLFSLEANRFAFSQDGRFLATSLLPYELDKFAVEIWDSTTFEQVRRLDGLTLLALDPDGSILAYRGNGDYTGWWDFESGKLLRPFQNDYLLTAAHAFSPDGRLVLGIGSWSELVIWDVSTGQHLWFGNPSGMGIFSSDGRYLATVDIDGIVRLWGLPPTAP